VSILWPWLMNGGTTVIAEPLTPLGRDRKVFTENGTPWRYKGVTAFPLIDHYARGESIDPFLDAFKGFNTLRCFDYVPSPPWATPWDPAPIPVVREFLRYVADRGWRVELVMLTDNNPARVAPAQARIEALAVPREPNLIIEAGNEPPVNQIDTSALRQSLERAGLLHCSGDSGEDPAWYGTYLTAHTARDFDWPRRAHDLLEYYNGGGPSTPSDPARRVPCVADEPIRPDQAAAYGTHIEQDFRAYFGACALFGGGATFHAESLKFGALPNELERRCAAASLEGLNAFPPDAPFGAYRRINDNTSRTYAVGNHAVRVRPTTLNFPEPGWTAIDADGILWRL
jgi:hypothetical protein